MHRCVCVCRGQCPVYTFGALLLRNSTIAQLSVFTVFINRILYAQTVSDLGVLYLLPGSTWPVCCLSLWNPEHSGC
jgi:hypothetical protein